MTRPLPDGAHAAYTAQGLLQRPKCAELIGAICAEWSNAEHSLAIYYGSLLFGIPRPGALHPHRGSWAAMQSFDLVPGIKQRMAMLKIAAGNLFSKDTTERFGKLLKKLQDAYGRRIVAAHGRWGISDQLPDEVTYQRGFGQIPEVYGVTDLIAHLCEITEASEALHFLFDSEMSPTLKSLSEYSIT